MDKRLLGLGIIVIVCFIFNFKGSDDSKNKFINTLLPSVNMIGDICKSEHLIKLKELKENMGYNCKTYVEIGVLYGGSLILQMNMKYPCKHIGIDMFNGFYGKDHDIRNGKKIYLNDKNHKDIVEENINKNNNFNQEFILYKGKSTDKNIINKVKNIDFLFIDGDHTKKGVIDDFINYKDKVNLNGIVAFDNYNDKAWPEVTPAVNELIQLYNEEYKIKEIYKNLCVIIKYK